MKDKEIERLIKLEEKRQRGVINLIASENYVSKDVLRALGSVFTNKYAEGYSGKRYYGGNEVIDALENLTKNRALKLFGLSSKNWRVNVQPYSGSPANLAVYLALVPLGQKIMGMSLSMGGHLTHGHKVSVTGKLWNWIHFGVSKKTELLDYDEIQKIVRREKPKLIVAGFTAYSRIIDFKKLRKICDESKAIFMVDMSHFAGLVAGGAYPLSFPCADVVTTTTHKTLRGPRSAMIFSRKEFSQAIDKAVFPGLQGGPHANQIAAVAVCLKEAISLAFKKYARQVVKNAKVLARELQKKGWRIISGGTDSHLFLVDTWARGLSGKTAQELLEAKKIIVNKNTIPFDTRSPFDPSGIRIGTPAVTTQGMKEKDMIKIAEHIDKILSEEYSLQNTLNVKKFYDKRYVENKFPYGFKPSDIVKIMLKYVPPGSLVDFGSGYGRNSLYLASHGFDVTGVDISSVATKQLTELARKAKLNIKTKILSNKDLFFIPRAKIFVSVLALHHFSVRDGLKALKKIQKITPQGGFNVIEIMIKKGDFYLENEQHSRRNSFMPNVGELKQMYKGWKILEYKERKRELFTKKANGDHMHNYIAEIIAQKV